MQSCLESADELQLRRIYICNIQLSTDVFRSIPGFRVLVWPVTSRKDHAILWQFSVVLIVTFILFVKHRCRRLRIDTVFCQWFGKIVTGDTRQLEGKSCHPLWGRKLPSCQSRHQQLEFNQQASCSTEISPGFCVIVLSGKLPTAFKHFLQQYSCLSFC